MTETEPQGSETRLSSNEVEAANRAEATALLIRAGYRVYRPEADVSGEDLILREPSTQSLLSVQLKSRLTVDDVRYGGEADIWMLFPDVQYSAQAKRLWFLVPHNKLFEWIHTKHGHTEGWKGKWSVATLSKEQRAFLQPYEVREGHKR